MQSVAEIDEIRNYLVLRNLEMSTDTCLFDCFMKYSCSDVGVAIYMGMEQGASAAQTPYYIH